MDRVPHVESERYTHKYSYKKMKQLENDVVADCCFILGKDFSELSYATVDKAATHSDILLAKLSNGLEYTSATMGAGEQAVVKIIETVRTASKGSLIIIDEPEALLHHFVIKKMLQILVKVASERKLQILCSSHWSGLLGQRDVQTYSIGKTITSQSPILIKGPDKKLLQHLLPETPKMMLWCEDVVAVEILKVAIRRNGYQSKFEVLFFGSSSNAFSIASHLALSNSQNEVVILDGDAEADLGKVTSRLKKTLSGTEKHIEDLRKKASSYISALNPRGSEIPEEFLLIAAKGNLEILSGQLNEEFQNFHLPANVKTGFYHLADRLDLKSEELSRQISEEIWETKDFKVYTSDVLQKCRELLSEPPMLQDFYRCELTDV